MKPFKYLRPLSAIAAFSLAASCAAAPPMPAPAPEPAQIPAGMRATDIPEAPPAPMLTVPLEFPPFHEVVLPNGLRVIVLEKSGLPVVNLDLYVASGTATDPAPAAGLADIVSEMLTKGTATMTADEISSTIEGVGGDLFASASSDFIRVGAHVLTDQTPLAFDLMSDVVLHPTFPQDEMDIVQTRTLSGLQAEMAQPAALAGRRFALEVYGEGHPYSLRPTPATVQSLARADLVAFHDAHFRADNAMLVVSGDVSAEEVEAMARSHFGDWDGGGAPQAVFVDPPARANSNIYFVHRPGSVQSNILVGHVAIRPENPDYYPLQVLNKILGGGTDSRLFTILREEKGWTYGAYSQISRPRDVGYFSASAEVRNEVTDSALVEILSQMRRMRDQEVTATELQSAKNFLIGSFPLRIETAGQIAAQIAQNRLLGLPEEALLNYRERIAAVTAADVQRVAREYVRPDRAVIVVVGDAGEVLESVEGVAPITLYSVAGDVMDRAALEVTAPTEMVDASALEPVTLVMGISMQGTTIATATTQLARDGDAWVATSTIAGALSQTSELRFLSDFTPVSSTSSMSQAGMTMGSDLTYADGRVTGTINLPPQMGGEQQVDTEVVAGTLLPEMDQWYIAAAELAPGKVLTVPVFDGQSGRAANITFTVAGTETVTVPAGTFETYRIEVSGGQVPMVLFVTQDAPHTAVKQEFVGQPVVAELQEIR
jgi:zinc protease